MSKPIEYHIWWADHKLERGPVPAAEAANILVHHLRTQPEDPVWLMPTAIDPRSVLEVALFSAIRRLRSHIEGMPPANTKTELANSEVLKSLLWAATETLIKADEQLMVKMVQRIDSRVPQEDRPAVTPCPSCAHDRPGEIERCPGVYSICPACHGKGEIDGTENQGTTLGEALANLKAARERRTT